MALKSTEKPKLLPPPREIPKFEVKMLIRVLITLFFVILGFNFGNSVFFYEYPLFGIKYTSQVLLALVGGLLGYYVVPVILHSVNIWFERLIVSTVVEIVSNFWELQSRKIQEQRRAKQKLKADKEKAILDTALKTAIVLDTSVLIDGRILEIIRLNFLDVPLIVPQEVIDELHLLSDSKDLLKRQKGRRGLDIIRDIKKRTNVIIKTIKNGSNLVGVDKLLVKFCKDTGTKMLTLDFNLEKVASVNNIKVLNINALANSIKTVLLPGEEIDVKIIHEGKEKQQGIAYLEDGTMLIVDDAKDKVGQQLHVTVVKVIQSPAGKIIFCK